MSIGDQATVRAAAQRRVDAILAERVRVGGLTNLNPSFGASGPNGIQSTLEYQIAALLVAQNTVGMSNFLPISDSTNFLPTSPVFVDAARRFGNMTEVVGMEQDTIVMQDIYHYAQDGIDENGRARGLFMSTGIRPTFMDRLESAGVRLPASAFRQRVMLED
jgi:hypothetical protein